MTFNMMGPSKHDYIASYESAVSQLQAIPDDKELQHQAVLALARMGSLDFAILEYDRYRLGSVRHHEDIMALRGRLSKDRYLTSTGKEATQHALNAAQEYEAAFQDSQGYYSGINSATMALVAGMPEDVVKARARHIADVLPPTENLTSTDYYFIEATRAECLLLLGDKKNANHSLRRAFEFDPLNYTAHATTLKQFRLILQKQKANLGWLKEFSSPRPLHFAGHIWTRNTQPKTPSYEAIVTNISDMIQQNDIGYGYGSLAAGADILIAELLIEEGAELHVILPSDTDTFLENSVKPFGDDWTPRFMTCLEKAQSVKILSPSSNATQRDLDLIAGNVAMGQAILKSQQFDIEALQILILDKSSKASMTFQHAEKWREKKLEQNIVPVDVTPTTDQAVDRVMPKALNILMMDSESKGVETFTSLITAVTTAQDRIAKSENTSLGICYAFDDAIDTLEGLIAKAVPNSIFVPDEIASSLALMEQDNFTILYAGMIEMPGNGLRHVYSIRL